MDFKQLDILLEKFWEGNTSLEEENQLKTFFLNSQNLPEKYASDKNYFTFLNKEQNIKISSVDFDEKVTSRIKKEKDNKPVSRIRYLYRNFASVAATILIVGGSLIYIASPSNSDVLMTIQRGDEIVQITDPNEALEMTKASFKSVNKSIEYSRKKLKPVKSIRKIDILK